MVRNPAIAGSEILRRVQSAPLTGSDVIPQGLDQRAGTWHSSVVEETRALDFTTLLPAIWAQTTTSAGGSNAPASGAGSLLILSLRRWCGSLTLSPPEASTSPFSNALWIWLLGLFVLFLVALVFQGPSKAIGQLFDLPGHTRLLASAIERVKRSGRLMATVVGVSVICWTTSQTLSYSVATGRDDEMLLIKGQKLSDVALNQGYLAALTPLRDLVGLGLLIPLLIAASVVLFQFSTDRWGRGVRPPMSIRQRASRWSTIGWGSAIMYALYRFVSLVSGNSELPLGGCVFLEALLVPLLMAMADGAMVAWVMVELRNAGLGDTEGDSLDPLSVAVVIPAAILACVLAFPSHYLGTGLWMIIKYEYLPTTILTDPTVASYLRWQLGWGLVILQAIALLFVGLFGMVPWSRGTPGDVLKRYFGLLRAEGGHLVIALAAGGAAAALLSAVAYMVLLSLPASSWGLSAADSYAHYGTIPVGLILAAALVDLGERSLPFACLAYPEVDEPAA
jgi:hypothetical protein